ncbi:Sporulation initiation inhibitor protein Soj [subsurface metagenome]
MGRIISVTNQKGGVGKTTTVINLGAALKEMGKSVLLIDMDPQGGLGIGLGVEPESINKSIYDVILDNIDINKIVVETKSGLYLAPSNIDLCGAELELLSKDKWAFKLKNSIDNITDKYDYILIDTPPSLGVLTINVLAAAKEVLIPIACEYYSLRALRFLLDSISDVKNYVNKEIKVLGIVFTFYDVRTLHSKEVANEIRESLKGKYKVFNSVIRHTVRFKESPMIGRSILYYAPNNPSALAYRNLAKEIEEVK